MYFQVDFFWINRDQKAFEWFVELLIQIEIQQAEMGGAMERFLELHMYMTALKQKGSLETVGLQMALDFLYKKVNYLIINQDLGLFFIKGTILY